ncbi:ATP-dependent DNA helicase [Salix suchowensis]|nr:ATP-dependent DNA helicase [Salix suchowensis]
MIHQFLQTRAADHSPAFLHPALHWDLKDLLSAAEREPTIRQWRIVENQLQENEEDDYVVAKGSNNSDIPVEGYEKGHQANLKRKRNVPGEGELTEIERSLAGTNTLSITPPLGVKWDSNSCAYDAVLVVVYNAWKDRFKESTTLADNDIMTKLAILFGQVVTGKRNLTYVREKMRRLLEKAKPNTFVKGKYASVTDIASVLLSSSSTIRRIHQGCPNGHNIANSMTISQDDSFFPSTNPSIRSSQESVVKESTKLRARCALCNVNLVNVAKFIALPNLLAVELTTFEGSLKVDRSISITSEVATDGTMWKHDGLVQDGEFRKDPEGISLDSSDGRAPAMAIYVLVP